MDSGVRRQEDGLSVSPGSRVLCLLLKRHQFCHHLLTHLIPNLHDVLSSIGKIQGHVFKNVSGILGFIKGSNAVWRPTFMFRMTG